MSWADMQARARVRVDPVVSAKRRSGVPAVRRARRTVQLVSLLKGSLREPSDTFR